MATQPNLRKVEIQICQTKEQLSTMYNAKVKLKETAYLILYYNLIFCIGFLKKLLNLQDPLMNLNSV